MSTTFTPVISQELQATVRNNPKIKRVYFDADNRHYFNAWKLRENAKDDRPESEWDFFGTGVFSHQQEIPGLFNVDKKKESISKGDPTARIVVILERKDIITAKVSGQAIQAEPLMQMQQFTPAPPIDIEELKKQILPPELLAMLEGIQNGSLVVSAAPVVQLPAEVDDTPPA